MYNAAEINVGTPYKITASPGIYESNIAPYAGIPLVSIPYTTFRVTLGLEMMNTASALLSNTSL